MRPSPITADSSLTADATSLAKAAADIRRFAKENDIKVHKGAVRTLDDLGDLVASVENDKSSHLTVLLSPATGDINVTCINTFAEEIFCICLDGTRAWRDEASLLIRRVLRAFDERYKIGTILDTYEYAMMVDEKEMYAEDNNELSEEEVDFDFSYLLPYLEGGEKNAVLSEYNSLAPATAEDVAAFVPKDPKEKDLKALLAEGIRLAEDTNPEHYIWSHGEYQDCDQDLTDGYVAVCELFFITTRLDDLYDYYCDDLDRRFNSGAMLERLAIKNDISHPENNEQNGWLIDVINWIREITSLLNT